MDDLKPCPDCAARIGALHVEGCDIERCPLCGGQMIGCHCDTNIQHVLFVQEFERMVWDGWWPGVRECREYGLYARMTVNQGLVRCGKDDPGAVEDLNTLVSTCRWSREHKRWIRQ